MLQAKLEIRQSIRKISSNALCLENQAKVELQTNRQSEKIKYSKKFGEKSKNSTNCVLVSKVLI